MSFKIPLLLTVKNIETILRCSSVNYASISAAPKRQQTNSNQQQQNIRFDFRRGVAAGNKFLSISLCDSSVVSTNGSHSSFTSSSVNSSEKAVGLYSTLNSTSISNSLSLSDKALSSNSILFKYLLCLLLPGLPTYSLAI